MNAWGRANWYRNLLLTCLGPENMPKNYFNCPPLACSRWGAAQEPGTFLLEGRRPQRQCCQGSPSQEHTNRATWPWQREIRCCLRMCEAVPPVREGNDAGQVTGKLLRSSYPDPQPTWAQITVTTVCQAPACATTALGPSPMLLIFHAPERWSSFYSKQLWAVIEAGSVTLDKALHLSEVFCKTQVEEERQRSIVNCSLPS